MINLANKLACLLPGSKINICGSELDQLSHKINLIFSISFCKKTFKFKLKKNHTGVGMEYLLEDVDKNLGILNKELIYNQIISNNNDGLHNIIANAVWEKVKDDDLQNDDISRRSEARTRINSNLIPRTNLNATHGDNLKWKV